MTRCSASRVLGFYTRTDCDVAGMAAGHTSRRRKTSTDRWRSLGVRPRTAGRRDLTANAVLTYVNSAPFQPAIAVGLGLPEASCRRRRDLGQAGPTVEVWGRRNSCLCHRRVLHDRRPSAPLRSDGDGWSSVGRCPHAASWRSHSLTPVPSTAGPRPFACCKRLDVIDAAVNRCRNCGGLRVSTLRVARYSTHRWKGEGGACGHFAVAPKVASASVS